MLPIIQKMKVASRVPWHFRCVNAGICSRWEHGMGYLGKRTWGLVFSQYYFAGENCTDDVKGKSSIAVGAARLNAAYMSTK